MTKVKATDTKVDAYEEFKKMGEKLKKEVKKEKEEKTLAVIASYDELSNQAMPESLANFFYANSDVGVEDIAGRQFPTLKITEVNSKSVLANGQRATVGRFFYSGDETEFEAPEVHILGVTRGYYAKPINETDKPKFTQIVYGVLVNGLKPFIMYISGTRLQNLWDFGKVIAKYTKSPNPVPMFAIFTTLHAEEKDSKYGKNHVVRFSLRDKEGKVKILTDLDTLKMLRGLADEMRSSLESFISNIEVGKENEQVIDGKDLPF